MDDILNFFINNKNEIDKKFFFFWLLKKEK